MTISPEVDSQVKKLIAAAKASAADDVASAWDQLEDAHVLAQQWALPHIRVHLAMMRLGLVTRDPREVLGQLIRVVIAGPGSKSGKVPLGNTGRARESLSTTRPVREDLRKLLEG